MGCIGGVFVIVGLPIFSLIGGYCYSLIIAIFFGKDDAFYTGSVLCLLLTALEFTALISGECSISIWPAILFSFITALCGAISLKLGGWSQYEISKLLKKKR